MAIHLNDDDNLGEGNETVLIVHPSFSGRGAGHQVDGGFKPAIEEQIEEVEGLARAISLTVIETRIVRVDRPDAGHLFGSGNRADIALLCEEIKPGLVIVNHQLSPVQQRNLEKEWRCKVIDRTGLILEIFGERAQTREGKIQVELAALEYQKSRLVRSWTHLERQRGGAGFMGGPGETQIEIDRRMIGDRITRLKKDLEQVRKNRDLQRRSRERIPFPIVALVGYTNAGKSTLFNHLTGANVYAEDLPFATLDPTMRKVALDNGAEIIIADTVGFIADLPTHLVAAFRATLEQVVYADVILHVRDISRPDHQAQRHNVIEILHDMGIEYDTDPRVIEVWNKIDAIADEEDQADWQRKAKYDDKAILISALKGTGMTELLSSIETMLARSRKQVSFEIDIADGEALAWLYKNAHITERIDGTEHILLGLDIEPADLGRFCERFSYEPLMKAASDTDDMRAQAGWQA